MANRTLRLVIMLSVVMGSITSVESSASVAQLPALAPMPRSYPGHNASSALTEPVQVLSSDNNYFLKIDLDDSRVHPRVMLANNDSGGVQSLYWMKRRLEMEGYTQWAIVNGDLFSSGCPGGVNCAQGLTYIDGQRKNNWSAYGNTWMVRGNIGFDSSNDAQVSVGDGQSKRHMTIGGGPRVLMGGGGPTCYGERITVGGEAKTLFPASGEQFDGDVRSWCGDTRPITMVGYSADGRYLYMGISRGGKTPAQLAQWLKDRGAHEILRFDSGSSTGMYHNGQFIGGTGSKAIANAFAVVVDDTPPSQPCPAPSLYDPDNGYTDSDRTITFRWGSVDCNHDGFTFRVKTVSNMESGGETVVDTGDGSTDRTVTFDSRWDNRDLYWSVKAANAPGGADWAPTRHFRIDPNNPPSISFNTANGNSANTIESRDQDWTFAGTASDSDGYVTKIDFVCHNCDNGGSGPGSTTGNNWSLTRTGMSGRNEISFRAYDDKGASTESRYLDLIIDLAAPSSRHNLVGTMGENGWYTSPVEVRLHADDDSTGRARVGVDQICYRLDGGSWQTRSGSDTSFTVTADGHHTVEYYAIDRLGNTESSHSVSFKIDKTLPTAPGAVTETHGTISGQWQKDWNDPEFTWGTASDTTSGLWYYRVDWADTLHVTSDAAYDPPAVRTGSYQIRVRAVDQAGNIGPEGPAFAFRYDGTSPHAPEIQNNDGVASGVWQNDVRTADFSWAVPHDEGSGIAGYNVYWGSSISGTNTSVTTSNSYVDATPICSEDETAIYHLRVRSQDNVGWQSEWVAYSLAYDGAPPTATLVANYGMTVTNQASVLLQILADDEGSGVTQMRLSNDARAWSEWTDIAEQLHWEIPAIGRRMQPIYLQVVDGAGNVSSVVSDTVYLEVNRARPKSESFWLWDDMMTSGSGVVTSTSYALRTSVGQSLDAPVSASVSYKLISGFQAGALAAPIETPGYTSYYQMGYVIAGGGTCTPTLQSTTYQMYGTLGQPAHVLTISSTSYTIQSGFWGGAGTDPAPPGSPPPPPAPTPPECEFYSVTINDDAPFTNSPTVSLDLCGPDPVEMMLSNNKYFAGATWQSYTRAISWTLDVSGSSVQSRFVYVRFRDSEDEIHESFSDQIIYDPNASEGQTAFDLADLLSPGDELDRGTLALQIVSEETTDLFVSALDDSSGLAEMQISSSPDFDGAVWEPYSAIAPITFTQDGEQTVYVRFRDNAGNVSAAAADSLLVDTTPPVGMANVVEGVVGPTAISATVALSAVDDTSGVSEVRISSLESLTDILWQPYVAQITMPISYTGEIEPVLYIQFRDVAGNASLVYSTTYLVDIEPPVLYVEVEPGSALTRTVTILAYDELTGLGQMRLSNDPLMIDGVATMPYTATVTWVFDEHKVVWVQLEDSVGNISEPYPAYAAEGGGLVYLPLTLRDYSE